MGKKKLVVLTGAGISAESGISTFRDAGGLWEGHDIMEVASIDGWRKNRTLVLDFYNQRRKQAMQAVPNAAHLLLADLEKYFEVSIVTQNVDDLHEKAGSGRIIHLHGELKKAQSSLDPTLVYELDHWEINLGDTCEKGSQLRPYIVWFGEMVPKMEDAIKEAEKADIFAVIGTSLLVYPAAGLIQYTPKDIPKFLIDPKIPTTGNVENLIKIPEVASLGTKRMFEELLTRYV